MSNFPKIPTEVLLKRLQPPTGSISMVLDTDTYNEVDDQFAVVYALLSEQLAVEAIYAAPFFNNRSSGPGDGMEKSYEEIFRLLDRLNHTHSDFVFRGSTSYLPGPGQPVKSEAAENLVDRAMQKRDNPLYVVAIGAITNVASAILMQPRIIENIVVVWLGGHPHYWHNTREFNLGQDLPASQLMFNCGVPLVQIPAKNVSEHLRTTLPELEKYVKGRGTIGDFLYETFAGYHTDHYAWAKEIWDIASIAYLLNPQWVPSHIVHGPILTNETTWSFDSSRHFIRVAIDTRRNPIFADMFRKLENYA